MSATTSINDYEAGRSAERGAILAEIQRRIEGLAAFGEWREAIAATGALEAMVDWIERRGE